jgi:hypothetical protein
MSNSTAIDCEINTLCFHMIWTGIFFLLLLVCSCAAIMFHCCKSKPVIIKQEPQEPQEPQDPQDEDPIAI